MKREGPKRKEPPNIVKNANQLALKLCDLDGPRLWSTQSSGKALERSLRHADRGWRPFESITTGLVHISPKPHVQVTESPSFLRMLSGDISCRLQFPEDSNLRQTSLDAGGSLLRPRSLFQF
jgi:hypothetical protein